MSRSRPSPPYSSGIVTPNRPKRLHLLDDGLGVLVGVLELGRDGDDFARDEPADRVDQGFADFRVDRRARRHSEVTLADAVAGDQFVGERHFDHATIE